MQAGVLQGGNNSSNRARGKVSPFAERAAGGRGGSKSLYCPSCRTSTSYVRLGSDGTWTSTSKGQVDTSSSSRLLLQQLYRTDERSSSVNVCNVHEVEHRWSFICWFQQPARSVESAAHQQHHQQGSCTDELPASLLVRSWMDVHWTTTTSTDAISNGLWWHHQYRPEHSWRTWASNTQSTIDLKFQPQKTALFRAKKNPALFRATKKFRKFQFRSPPKKPGQFPPKIKNSVFLPFHAPCSVPGLCPVLQFIWWPFFEK